MPASRKLVGCQMRRDFTRTHEPEGRPSGRSGDGSLFMGRIHGASTAHSGFRPEVNGVLQSWAVPTGPSADPHGKRLTIPAEHHPVKYGEFGGVIAEGEYDEGSVTVRDEGMYPHARRVRSVRTPHTLRQVATEAGGGTR